MMDNADGWTISGVGHKQDKDDDKIQLSWIIHLMIIKKTLLL